MCDVRLQHRIISSTLIILRVFLQWDIGINQINVCLICTMYYAIVFYRDLVHGLHVSQRHRSKLQNNLWTAYYFYLIFSFRMCVLFFIRITTNYPNDKCFLIDANIYINLGLLRYCFYGVYTVHTCIGFDCFVNNYNTNVMNHLREIDVKYSLSRYLVSINDHSKIEHLKP